MINDSVRHVCFVYMLYFSCFTTKLCLAGAIRRRFILVINKVNEQRTRSTLFDSISHISSKRSATTAPTPKTVPRNGCTVK